MPLTIALGAAALDYPEGGGHLWVYMNWALGLRALGCDVVWLEPVRRGRPPETVSAQLARLLHHLRAYGLGDRIALWAEAGATVPATLPAGCCLADDLDVGDVLLDLSYTTPPNVLARFRRTALVDIDPGLLQTWMASGGIQVAPHDVYVTTGETVGTPEAHFPDAGVRWLHVPPCVSVDSWPVSPPPEGAPFTTVTHWFGKEWMVDAEGPYRNDKRTGFLPFLDLPKLAAVPLELALCLAAQESYERRELEARGWRVRHSYEVASTPWDYQAYIRSSRGEFSCAKPSCIRLQNAWVSDRTLCYLATGRPAVVQHTGPSRLLPDAAGLFRFRDLPEAVRMLERVALDYPAQARAARSLAEEVFDARQVASRVLDWLVE